MRVSDLTPAKYPQSPSVELPNSDAHRLFTNDFNKQSFIEAHGDVEIVWNERVQVLGSSSLCRKPRGLW